MVRRIAAALGLAVMTAVLLSRVAPSPVATLDALRHPQSWGGISGADTAVLTVAVAACWLLLGWLILGLAIGVAGELPGVAGRSAQALATVVLPRAIRQAVALTLGVGIVTAGASLAAADPAAPPPGSTAPSDGATVDWPVRPPAVPAPPAVAPPSHGGPRGFAEPVNGGVLVAPGDSLWAIAGDSLDPGATPSQIAAAVTAWYWTNREVVGPDPDLIHPGQHLLHPTPIPPAPLPPVT